MQLQQLATGLENIQFHDLQPVERMADLLSLADLHLLPQIVGAADLVLPSKLTNMLASGRPVIATAAEGTGLHSEVEGAGFNTAPGDPSALASAIEQVLDDEPLAHKLGAVGRLRAYDRWSQEVIIDQLDGQIRQI